MPATLKENKESLQYYNPWQGCEKISMACDNCWYNKGETTITRTEEVIPYKGKVFICNRSDFFLPQADEWREEEWDRIYRYSNAEFLLVTKRPENVIERLPNYWGLVSERCSIAITVEHRNYVSRLDILEHLNCKHRIVFLCPLLSFIDLSQWSGLIDLAVISKDILRPPTEETLQRQISHLKELNLNFIYLKGE